MLSKNEKIVELEKEISKLEDQIEDLEKLKDRIAKNEKTVESEKEILKLEDQIAELKDEKIAKLKEEYAELKKENLNLKAKEASYRQKLSDDYIDDIINTEHRLYTLTGLGKNKFNILCEKLQKYVISTKDVPLLSEDHTNSDNNDKYSPIHVLLFTLYYLKNYYTQMLAGFANVDAETMNRHIHSGKFILKKILPTPKKLAKIISHVESMSELEKIIPQKHLYIDGTYAAVSHPQDTLQDTSPEYYLGNRKTPTYNTIIVSNIDHLILHAVKSFTGSTNDFAMLKEDPPELGKWLDSMKNSKTNHDSKMIIFSDLRYVRIDKLYPGAISKQPRKKAKKQTLTMTFEELDARSLKKKIKIEDVICRLKQYRILTDPYAGTQEEFDESLELVSGLVNFNIMHKNKKYRHLLEKIS